MPPIKIFVSARSRKKNFRGKPRTLEGNEKKSKKTEGPPSPQKKKKKKTACSKRQGGKVQRLCDEIHFEKYVDDERWLSDHDIDEN